MIKKNFLKKIFLSSLLLTPIVISYSCSAEDKATVRFNISTKYFVSKSDDNAIQEYEKLFNETAQELFNSNSEKYQGAIIPKLEIVSQDEKSSSFQNVAVNKVNAAIVNIKDVINDTQYIDQNIVIPYAETLTRAFKNHTLSFLEKGNYKSNPENFNIGKDNEINEYFRKTPFSSWNKNDQKWDGSKFEIFYDKDNKLTNWYSGMITIVGTENELNMIRKAWDDKNWEKFSSFGIVHGKKNKQATWLAANKLFKDHFGLSDQSPIEKLDKNLITQGSGQETYTYYTDKNKKQIFIDDMYSFAWTFPKDKEKEVSAFKLAPNTKMEILALTNPISYDIIIFNNSVNEKTRLLFLDTLIKLSKSNKDDYGKKSGYNGYKKIDDFPKLKQLNKVNF
ncbi:ABC transporter thiamine pyrophosphate-binding lipoprotein p37/Cypl [[Mycoplasma] collis]|uniref:ABC transporter thiamine pyrophosphate-binding lipoprotein p37/Cypl n=1 Tax=[Mycoplasma] collis TaxID=2127 RepID=UPI00051C4D7E|nr:hypothetical protein [[Mycoplasma] collis]